MTRGDMVDVAVVGGGVVGTATALGLARGGATVALVEAQVPAPWQRSNADLRVYAFAPDNAAWLESLDVWREITSARAPPYRAMRVWDAAGGGELAFDADAFARPQLGWIVEHALLVDRLWHAAERAGVELHAPDTVQAMQVESNHVSLELADGGRARARWVVAADGADSRIREWAGIAAAAHDYGQRGVVAFIDTEQPHAQTCWQRFQPGGPLAVLPFVDADGGGAHRSSIVWTLPDVDAQRVLDLDDDAFGSALTDAFGGRLGAMTTASPRVAFPLRRQLARSLRSGRVLVVGDAAHVVHPLAGQGVNLGLRDASALCAALGRAGGGASATSTSRLDRWARTRRSENAVAAGTFEALNRLFSSDALAPTLLRGPLLGLAGRARPVVHALWQRAAGLAP